jgi:hypothetical protein
MLPITYGNILAVFFKATDLEILQGAQWYTDAQSAALIMSRRYKTSLEICAGVIAGLSPNNNWVRNLIDANSLIQAYTVGGVALANEIKVCTYNANKRKALNILEGCEPLDVLGGLKVKAFYNCILGSQDDVCVDGHAYAIWKGERIPTTKTPSITPKMYAVISEDYRQTAAAVNNILSSEYTPAQIQAITWIVWRRLVK